MRLKDNPSITIQVDYSPNRESIFLGENGVLYLTTSYDDSEANIFDESDIEEKTTFSTTIADDYSNRYNVIYRLWKPKNKNLVLFYKINQSIDASAKYFLFNDISFDYKDTHVNIHFNSASLDFVQLDSKVPFLYANEQNINVEDGKENYFLNFNIEEYNNETLMLTSEESNNVTIILDKCLIEQKNLKCRITKSKIIEIAKTSNQTYKLDVFAEYRSFYKFKMVFDISINYKTTKENIYIGINSLLKDSTNRNIYSYIAYETNITDINNIHSGIFTFRFRRTSSSYSSHYFNCNFKKTTNTPLLFICYYTAASSYTYYIGQSTPIYTLEDINIKYNFIIPSFYNSDQFSLNYNRGSFVKFSYPNILDFTKQEIYTIDYCVESPYSLDNIKLDLDSSNYLECENKNGYIKRCEVPKSHFTANKNGYYNTYASDKQLYELAPIQVIFEKEYIIEINIKKEYNMKVIQKGKNGPIILITDYFDEENIFNNYDIKEDTDFTSTIIDNYKNSYEVSCKFWNQKEDNLRIICYLKNGSLKDNNADILLENIKFEYNNSNITIRQSDYIEVEQLEYDIPFLYSEPQNININNNDNFYYLNFTIESYENELLYIYGQSNNNYAILDSCEKEGKILTCEIKKEKLEETLTKNYETFKVGAINDKIGIINLDYISGIQISYDNIKKEDIYVELKGFISSTNEVGVPMGIETNVLSVSNLITDTIDDKYYFKKVYGSNLTLFIKYPSEGRYYFDDFLNQRIFNNIHYKYNFIVNPTYLKEEITIRGNGSDIKLIYPEKLDFKSSDSITIRYIMSNPSLTKIKLDIFSPNLECENLKGLKKCTVSKTNFVDNFNGYFYTYYLNDYKVPIKYDDVSPLQVQFPKEDTIFIYLEKEDNEDTIYVGQKQILYFVTNYTDDENIFKGDDIETKTSFVGQFIDKNNTNYNIKCKLWKPENEKIRIICSIQNMFNKEIKVRLNPARLNYNNNKFRIISNLNYITIVKRNNLPFLYSDKQIIRFEEDKKAYEIKFKMEDYFDETLILKEKNYMILNECSTKENELICAIDANDLKEILVKNNQIFKLMYIDSDKNIKEFETVFDIIITYNNIKKEDIYIGITKINDIKINKNNYISYETNITNIPNMISGEFNLEFNSTNNNNNNDNYNFASTDKNCKLKKSTETPLLIICKMYEEGSFNLGKIENVINLEDINYKFNFLISKGEYYDEFSVSGISSNIDYVYPKVLDLRSKNQIYIEYYLDNPQYLSNIRINPNGNDLNCENIGSSIKRCLVQKTHFENLISGYYYTYHEDNDNSNYLRFYELSPFQVILPDNEIVIRIKPENNTDSIRVGSKSAFLLVTNYNDKERNIFIDGNIEKSTQFESRIIIRGNYYDNHYNVSCRLWKSNDENIRLICKPTSSISTSYNSMSLVEVSFNYYQYRLIIIPENPFKIIPINKKIPFLYSSPQNITIDDKQNSYNLKFKVGSLNNELLLIHGQYNNYALLDNCKYNGKELNCEISKEKLEEILVLNNEQFNISAIHDSIGLISLDHIAPININYNNVIKEDIFIGINKLIGNTTELEVPIGFESNITNIPNLLSDTFTLNGYKCYFRKAKNKPLILYFKISSSSYEANWNISEEIIFNEIHYKYNFRIQPFTNDETIDIINTKGVEINFMFPDELNFLSASTQTIRYIILNDINYRFEVRLSPPDVYLKNCQNLERMVICTIEDTEFINKTSGYYTTYFTDRYGDYYKIYDSSPINITVPDIPDESDKTDEPDIQYDGYINITINEENNIDTLTVENSGVLYFVTNYTDNESFFDPPNYDENTSFPATILMYNYYKNSFPVICRLWKPKDETLRVLCEYSYLYYDAAGIYFMNTSFVYNNYSISINSSAFIKIKKVSATLPFLYSDKQIINIQNSNSYDLQFKIGKYNNELLILHLKEKEDYSYIILDNCIEDAYNKKLNCKITKEKLEVILTNKIEILKLSHYNTYQHNFIISDYVFDIIINYNNIIPQNVDVKITDLLTNYVQRNDVVVYETDVKSINNVTSDFFNLNFTYSNTNVNFSFTCFFKKIKDEPLYLFCKMESNYDGDYHLGEISQKIILDNIHIKYKFNIQPTFNNETFKFGGYNGGYIIYSIPTSFDFYKNQYAYINYLMLGNVNGKELYLKLNTESSSYISCSVSSVNITKSFVSCTVPKSHFDGSKSGSYYLYHREYFSYNYIRYYELPPVQIILPKETDIFIKITSVSTVEIIKGTVIFITDYNDNDKGIFKNKDAETIKFKTTIYVSYSNYNADCRLWNPIDENLRIICNINEISYGSSEVTIRFNDYTFNQDKYQIYLTQDSVGTMRLINYDKPLLYSERKIIKIEDNTNSYNLKFKVEYYNNEIIGIVQTQNTYDSSQYTPTIAIMDSCQLNNKELDCKISKSKLEEILTHNNGKFMVVALYEDKETSLIVQQNILGIYINNNIVIKKIIYVGITKLLTSNAEQNTPYGFETNITDIENLNTDLFTQNGYSYYFKKLKGKPLLLLTKSRPSSSGSSIWSINTEVIKSEIHYKYIFRIQPYNGDTNVISYGSRSSEIMLTFPEELDFRNKDSIVLRFIVSSSSDFNNIRLNPSGPILNCKDYEIFKECTVPFSHFLGKESGFYRIYHGNLIENYEAPLINVILPTDNMMMIYVNDADNYGININLGLYGGIVYFIANYTDKDNIFNANDIEENTKFETSLIDSNNNNYYTNCRLWKPLNEKIRIFCKLNNRLYGNSYLRLTSGLINYHNKKIAIMNQMFQGIKISVSNIDDYKPFLYSDRQTINIEKGKEEYELKLKYDRFNFEKIFIFPSTNYYYNHIALDDCTTENGNVICKIKKENVEEILGFSGDNFKCGYFDSNEYRLMSFDNVFDITINYNNVQKENIYVNIVRLLSNEVGINSYIAYETNITSLNDIVSYEFYIKFNNMTDLTCFFKKTIERPLVLLCKVKNKYQSLYLGEIKDEIILSDIHYKYNFLIQPVVNKEVFYVEYLSRSFLYVYPKTFDFYYENSYQIYFYSNDNTNNINYISLIEEDNPLSCSRLSINTIKCTVSSDYFSGKPNGYYNTYYKINNLYNIVYELSPIEILLPQSNEIIIKVKPIEQPVIIGVKGAILLEVDYNRENIDVKELEKLANFKANFSSNGKIYEADCKEWTPEYGKIKMICKFNENLNNDYTTQTIRLDKYIFDYKTFKIVLLSDPIKVTQSYENIALVYNDRQVVNIDNSYEAKIKLKKGAYNGETLLLQNGMKNIKITCKDESTEVICTLNKDKLNEILSYSGEKFSLGHIIDSEGIFQFPFVYDIIFNFTNIPKQDIYIDITKILSQNSERNNFVVYETNVTSISQITTDYFYIYSYTNGMMRCMFKKINGKLLFFCNSDDSELSYFRLGKIDNMIMEDDNIFYRFNIKETENLQSCNIYSGEGTKIFFADYPNEFDFTSKSKYTVRYLAENINYLKGIIFDINTNNELYCSARKTFLECSVDSYYFTQSGNYYTYHSVSSSYTTTKIIAYEVPSVKVTLAKRNDDDNDNEENSESSSLAGIIAGSVIGGLILIALIVFFIWRCHKRKTEGDYSEKKEELIELKNDN